MDRDEIAREIARRDLFRRPSDNRHPPSDQLRLRARKPQYQHLFECSDSSCSKIRLRAGRAEPSTSPRATVPTGMQSEQQSSSVASRHRLPESSDSGAWYEKLRERYRPERVRYLLIAESPPDPGDGKRRFFYSPALTIDNLYRSVAQAVYGERDDIDLRDKPAVLDRLRQDGFWLIDAVEYPVNKLANSARARAIEEGVPRLIERCIELAPECGVIVCHSKVYEATARALQDAGVAILHDEALPFPLGNWRARFVEGFRRALRD